LSVITSKTTLHTGSKEHPMITEQTHIIVLQLTDELLARLRPFMAGLDITTTPHSQWAYQEVYEQSHFAGYETVKQYKQRLTMRREVYDTLIARVGDALDYDVRWQPMNTSRMVSSSEFCPLELTNSSHMQEGCPTCGHKSSPTASRCCAPAVRRSL
jgi:hypothetical protein